MSVHHVEWAIQQTHIKGAAYTVLLILATMANDENQCWPKVETLAEKAHLTARGTQKALAALQSAGVLAIAHRQRDNGQSRASKYELVGCTTFTLEGVLRSPWRVNVVQGEGERGAPTRVNNVPKEGEPRSPHINQKQEPTTFDPPMEPPPPEPPARAPSAAPGGGGLDLDDEETEALLIELQTITGRLPANYERSVLSIPEFAAFRRRALLELRRDWVTVKQKSNTGWWLKRVIERLIEEHVRANAPLFPIDDAAAAERRRKYMREDDDEFESSTWVRPWETTRQDGAYH